MGAAGCRLAVEYTVFRGLEGECWSLTGQKLSITTSTTRAACAWQARQKIPRRCASVCGPEAEFLAQLQCIEICRALFPGKLFVQDITLEQFIHTGSCAVWPQSELPPAYGADAGRGIILLWKPQGSIQGTDAQYTSPFCAGNTVICPSQYSVQRESKDNLLKI